MRLVKCDVYTAKETLGYRGRKTYMAAAKREEQEEKQTHKQITNALQCGGERNPWKNRTVNEEKDRNTQRQEAELSK